MTLPANPPLEIVVPMAGRGSRFADAGWADPKPLIPMPDGRRMIELVVDDLRPRRAHRFSFVVRAEHRGAYGLDALLRSAAPDCRILEVGATTQGAAETVAIALAGLDGDAPLMVANSDQHLALDIDAYLAATDVPGVDGVIMTMRADHPKWSYASVDARGWVDRVVEKQVISRDATVGVYNFARLGAFLDGYAAMVAADRRTNGEFYVAPVYNELVAAGQRFSLVDVAALGGSMHGLGTPEDLLAWRRLLDA